MPTDQLRLNGRLRVLTDGPEKETLFLCSPVRGEELKRLAVSRREAPALFDAVAKSLVLLRRGLSPSQLGPGMASFLHQWGVLVDSASEPGDVAFRCELPEPGTCVALTEQRHTLDLQQHAQLLPFGEAPEGIVAPFESFAPASELIWVRSRPSGIWLPYWPSAEMADTARSVLAKSTHVGQLAPDLLAPLARVGQWSLPSLLRRREAHGYRAHRSVELRGLLDEPWLGALRDHYAAAIWHGYFGRDRGPVNQFFYHGEPLARFLQSQLTPLVSSLWTAPLRPSYTYSVSYRGNAVLEAHTDRAQCEHTISLLLDYTPRPDAASPWALCLVNPATSQHRAIQQRLGDGLLFRGRELPHYRGVLPEDHTSTSVFLHYVASDFAGSLT